MRYYDLDTNGKVKGSYAVPQPNMTLHLLGDAPENSFWDGSKWVLDKKSVLAVKAVEVNSIREKKIAAGIPFMFPDGPGTIQTRDQIDVRNIQANVVTALILQAAGETNPVMVFRDMENALHKMSPKQMVEMGLYVAQYGQVIYSASWTLKDAAATMPAEEINDLDVEANWP